jgi:hypothetical protein
VDAEVDVVGDAVVAAAAAVIVAFKDAAVMAGTPNIVANAATVSGKSLNTC